MELKELHTADTIRHAMEGHILLTKEERYAAVASAIEKVEKSNARANCARSKGFHNTADILDRLTDTNIEEVDRLLALPIIDDDNSDWTVNEFFDRRLQA